MSWSEEKDVCAKRIQERMDLAHPPKIVLLQREVEGVEPGGRHFRLDPEEDVVEPLIEDYEIETNDKCEYVYNPAALFEDEYPGLHFHSRKSYAVFFYEVMVKIGDMNISAGFNHLIGGTLKNGSRFMAVLSVFIREMFRGCGLYGFLKKVEMHKVNDQACAFVQTWHASDNPHFLDAIIPSLKRGYTLYHGSDDDVEDYEKEGYVHLVYSPGSIDIRSEVEMRGYGDLYRSPGENNLIIDRLIWIKEKDANPGRAFTRISSTPDLVMEQECH
jgi:hypothetical protein